MDVTKVKRIIGQCNDPKELGEVIRACRDRQRLIDDRKREKAHNEKHEWAKSLKRGDKIYCCAQGTFLGGGIQRGDSFYVYHYQPRAKRLWFHREEEPPPRNSGKWIGMGPLNLVRYEMRSEPPEEPLGQTERAAAEACGRVVSKVLENKEEEKQE